jgi:hypothetical protein
MENRKALGFSRDLLVVTGLVGFLAGCAKDDAPDPGPDASLQFGEAWLEVGVLDTPETHVFGEIRDVVALADGRFIVLDGHAMNLRLFDSEGNLLGTAGGHGEGPGEFRGPEAITVVGDSAVLVLDGGNRLARFHLQPSSIVYVENLALETIGRDICALGDRVFLQGQHEGFAVHEIDGSGKVVTSFHPVPEDVGYDLGPVWNPLLRDMAVSGFLACLEDPPIVATVSEWLPDISAYDPEGVLRWKTIVPGFHPVEPVLTSDGGQTWDRGEGSDGVLSMVAHPAGVFVVQTVHVAAGDDYYGVQPTTYLLDADSGEIRTIGSSLPTVRAMSRTAGFGVLRDPFPRVSVISVESSR